MSRRWELRIVGEKVFVTFVPSMLTNFVFGFCCVCFIGTARKRERAAFEDLLHARSEQNDCSKAAAGMIVVFNAQSVPRNYWVAFGSRSGHQPKGKVHRTGIMSTRPSWPIRQTRPLRGSRNDLLLAAGNLTGTCGGGAHDLRPAH